MKKITALLLAAIMAAGLTGCGSDSGSPTEPTNTPTVAPTDTSTDTPTGTPEDQAEPDSVRITSLNANKEEIELTVPYNPERVAVLDMAALDILDNLGLGDRVVGSAQVSLDYLQQYADQDSITNLGTIKEADLEAVMACDPEIIFIGGRLSASYDALSEIAPVIYLSTDAEIGVVESVSRNAAAIASIFGKEEEIAGKTNDFAARIQVLQTAAEGKTALVGLTTSGSFNLLGNDGRCSIIGIEIGFENLAASDTSSTHGNESSFELVVQMNPDYIFVLDRDSAIGTDGAKLAQEIMENELVMGTEAYQNGNLIYLSSPAVWYTAEGGITALDVMLSDLESALLK